MFDSISKDDLIVAFFPCVYFECWSMMLFCWANKNYDKMTVLESTNAIIERDNKRHEFYQHLLKFVYAVKKLGLRMVFENPWSMQHFLKQGNFVKNPDIVDNNRLLRGDYFVKPTAFWFFNCKPSHGFTYQNDKEKRSVSKSKSAPKAGLCSEERSMISPDYARNWICDFILGKKQEIGQLSLF